MGPDQGTLSVRDEDMRVYVVKHNETFSAKN
jgi:hypothetical protein